MNSIFNDLEKDVFYEALCSCGKDFAKEQGNDEKEEDVVIIYNFLKNVGRMDFVDKVVDKIREKGYNFVERT